MHDEDNDGGFPDESPVEVRYPRSKQEERGDRSKWPWLPGSIVAGFTAVVSYPASTIWAAPMAGRPPAAPAPAGIATCRA